MTGNRPQPSHKVDKRVCSPAVTAIRAVPVRPGASVSKSGRLFESRLPKCCVSRSLIQAINQMSSVSHASVNANARPSPVPQIGTSTRLSRAN